MTIEEAKKIIASCGHKVKKSQPVYEAVQGDMNCDEFIDLVTEGAQLDQYGIDFISNLYAEGYTVNEAKEEYSRYISQDASIDELYSAVPSKMNKRQLQEWLDKYEAIKCQDDEQFKLIEEDLSDIKDYIKQQLSEGKMTDQIKDAEEGGESIEEIEDYFDSLADEHDSTRR